MILFGIIHAYLLLWTGEILYFYGVTRLYGKLERHQLYYIVFSIWVFQLIMSPI